MPSHYSCEGIEQDVEIDGLAQDAEHMHTQGVVEQIRRKLARQQNRGGRIMQFPHQLDHLHSAELGHLLIEHGHMDGPGFDEIQCFSTGSGGNGLNALGLEQLAHRLVPAFLLVGQKNGEPS
jgi:hypothetical protein